MAEAEIIREIPRQARARATVQAVLDAAAQVLDRDGEAGFNTNAVAERAGVSIGTLYRYFPDKRAVLTALAQRETAAVQATGAALQAGGLAPDRAMIRAFLQGFGGRSLARRVAVRALLAQSDPKALAQGHAPAEAALTEGPAGLSPVQAFVLTRAVHGAMRAAVLEGADFLLDRAFEDELVRLARAYAAARRTAPR